jgi:hypothetical protein
LLDEPRVFGNNLIHVTATNMANVIIKEGLEPLEEIWGVETALYLPELYAGTIDVIGVYKGKSSIIDFKTSKKMKKKEDIIDYRDQISAYRIAQDAKYNTNIEQGVILMVSRDLKFECMTYSHDEMEQGGDAFLQRVATFYETFEGF